MKNDFNQLLIDIQKKSQITIETIRDLKNLKEEIDSITSIVGFNTLRRLFGFLPSTVPSKSTLDTLSKYLGFTSYSNYLNNKNNYDEWYFQQKLLLLQFSKNNSDDFNIEFIETGFVNRNNIVAIANFISFYIQNNEIQKLKLIFEKIKFQSLPDSERLKFATMITFNLLNIDKTKSLNIYSELMIYNSFRETIPLYYVDYSNLNGFYEEILRIVVQKSTNLSEHLFVSLMLFYKKFYSAEDYNNIQIELPMGFNNFHPVLKGRYLSYKIMSNDTIDKNLMNYIFDEFKKNRISFIAQEIILTLIIKSEYEILSAIFDKHYEDIFESNSWSHKTTNSISLIGLANINWYSNSFQMARRNLEIVELEKVELSYYDYISLFYYYTKLKISFSENDTNTNTDCYKTMTQLVSKTGFELFLKKSQPYLIN